MTMAHTVHVGCFSLAVFLSNTSAGLAEPSIPIENQSGQYQRLIVTDQRGGTRIIELDRGARTDLVLAAREIYDLSVSDAHGNTSIIGRYDLWMERAKNAK